MTGRILLKPDTRQRPCSAHSIFARLSVYFGLRRCFFSPFERIEFTTRISLLRSSCGLSLPAAHFLLRFFLLSQPYTTALQTGSDANTFH